MLSGLFLVATITALLAVWGLYGDKVSSSKSRSGRTSAMGNEYGARNDKNHGGSQGPRRFDKIINQAVRRASRRSRLGRIHSALPNGVAEEDGVLTQPKPGWRMSARPTVITD